MGRAMQHMAMEPHTTRTGATQHSRGTMGMGSRAGARMATIMARDKTDQPVTAEFLLSIHCYQQQQPCHSLHGLFIIFMKYFCTGAADHVHLDD